MPSAETLELRPCVRPVPHPARCDGVAAFPPPELPGFIGTTQRSDFHAAYLPCSPLQARSGILPAEEQRGSPWLPPRHDVKREPASDPGRPRDARHARAARYCLQRCRALGHDPTVTTFRGSIPSRTGGRPAPLVLASFPDYASTRPLPSGLQAWIRGRWLAATPAGLHPLVVATLPGRILHPVVRRRFQMARSLNLAHRR